MNPTGARAEEQSTWNSSRERDSMYSLRIVYRYSDDGNDRLMRDEGVVIVVVGVEGGCSGDGPWKAEKRENRGGEQVVDAEPVESP